MYVSKFNGNQIDLGIETSLNSTMLNVTYSELKNLRDTSKLIPGRRYRITDYVTMTNGHKYSKSAMHTFDIIVIADSSDKLNENATAIQHSGDTYFENSNLNGWKLKYCIDNDSTRCSWVDDTCKGFIYYMEDENNNICEYDFKNIMFKRYKITSSSIPTNFNSQNTNTDGTEYYPETGNLFESLYGKFVLPKITGRYDFPIDFIYPTTDIEGDNFIYCYTFTIYTGDYENIIDASVINKVADVHLYNNYGTENTLSGTVFISSDDILNIIDEQEYLARECVFNRCVESTFGSSTFVNADYGCDCNIIMGWRHQKVENTFRGNIIMCDMTANDDSKTFGFNAVGTNVYGNVVVNKRFTSNNLLHNFSHNIIDCEFSYNNFGVGCIRNIFNSLNDTDVKYNRFGDGFQNNEITLSGNSYMKNNDFGVCCTSNKILIMNNSFNNNKFGNYFSHNSVSCNKISLNNIGNYVANNIIDIDTFSQSVIDNYFTENTIIMPSKKIINCKFCIGINRYQFIIFDESSEVESIRNVDFELSSDTGDNGTIDFSYNSYCLEENLRISRKTLYNCGSDIFMSMNNATGGKTIIKYDTTLYDWE